MTEYEKMKAGGVAGLTTDYTDYTDFGRDGLWMRRELVLTGNP